MYPNPIIKVRLKFCITKNLFWLPFNGYFAFIFAMLKFCERANVALCIRNLGVCENIKSF